MTPDNIQTLLRLYDIRAAANNWRGKSGQTTARGKREGLVWLKGIFDGAQLFDKAEVGHMTQLVATAAEIGVDRTMAGLRGG